MKKTIVLLLAFIVMTISSSFNSVNTRKVLLILEDNFEEESFSIFTINENDNVLVGNNTDEHLIKNGIYRIIGSSNNKFYNHNIIIKNSK